MSAREDNPFIGLRPFQKDDAPRLFGRDRDLALMLDRVRSGRTTLLFAASGAGKTSFLNAKLIPSLGARDLVIACRNWVGDDPKRSLASAAIQAIGEFGVQPVTDPRAHEVEVESLRGLVATLASRGDVDTCVFVLDQFEEFFNNDGTNTSFVTELSAIINDTTLDVRVLISMREEFLGELSVFDNLVPDLFGNYYRLRNPTRNDGARIVEASCGRYGVAVDADGVEALVTDLSRTVRGVALSDTVPTSLPEVQTDSVVLPYMQLVCHELWNRASGSLLPFLHGYRRGDALVIRDSICTTRLNALDEFNRTLLARALDYLVTVRGAKVACETRWLSRTLRVGATAIVKLLEDLSRGDTPIFKRSDQPDATVWFELYHDMYGPFLLAWRAAELKLASDREAQRLRDQERRWTEGIQPAEIVDWEEASHPLDKFWVYLPDFLACDPTLRQRMLDVMAHNISAKGTDYLYIVETPADVRRLFHLVADLRTHPLCLGNDPVEKVHVLVLAGIGSNGVARAVSGLLHLGNCWIANPGSVDAEGYEVAWDDSGLRPIGGRRLPRNRLNRIVTHVSEIIQRFPAPTFEGVTEQDVEKVVRHSPWIRVEAPDTRIEVD